MRTIPCRRVLIAGLGLLLAHAGWLDAQQVGKVQGRILDSVTQRPLAGAQVYIEGTRLGNLTDESGFYFINNVPAGPQRIEARLIGYRAVALEDRVLSGQTHTFDFLLTSTPVEIQPLLVVAELHPLVPRDQVSSKAIITTNAIEDLPIDRMSEILVMQPGVVVSNYKTGLSIRGGRSGEEAMFVDGVLLRSFNLGSPTMSVGRNALAEVSVITGGFSAEYGEAQSGIINYVTKTRPRAWGGAARFETDDFMPKEMSIGFSRLAVNFGGPLISRLSGSFAGSVRGQKSVDSGKGWQDVPIYIAHGIDTTITYRESPSNEARSVVIPNFVLYDQGGRIPYANSDEYTLDGSLDYTYGAGSRIFLTEKRWRTQSRSLFGGGWSNFYNPLAYSGSRRKADALILSWAHNIVRTPENALAFDLKIARTHNVITSGLLNPEWQTTHVAPAFGFTVDDFQFLVEDKCPTKAKGCVEYPVNDELIERFQREGTTLAPFDFAASAPLAVATEYALNPYGVLNNFTTKGVLANNTGYSFSSEDQWQFRGTLDWQINRYHRLKIGAEHLLIDTRTASTPYRQGFNAIMWDEHPRRSALFAQERFDAGDVVIEAGLRYDRFDPRSRFPVIPGVAPLYSEAPDMWFEAPVRQALSPRLGVAFPVTVNTTFRLSYGHFTQVPDLNEYFRMKNCDHFKQNACGVGTPIARPTQLARTIGFEFGIRQLVNSDFVLDLAAFHRDKLRDISVRQYPYTYDGVQQFLPVFTNSDFGNVRGIDARLERRLGGAVRTTLGYSYQDARNTGTDPYTYMNLFWPVMGQAAQLLGQPTDPPEAMKPTEENRKHNFTATFELRFPRNGKFALRDFGVFATGYLASGLPYTSIKGGPENQALRGPPSFLTAGGKVEDGEISTRRMPWRHTINLRIAKGLSLGGTSASLYADIRNVLNTENWHEVFLRTGGLTDAVFFSGVIQSHREQLGGGTMKDGLNLRLPMATIRAPDCMGDAQCPAGIRNEADQFLIQRAEARFGNGDGIYTKAEQEATFGAYIKFGAGGQYMVEPGRRMRVGIELAF